MQIFCSVIVPVYNEELVIRESYKRLTSVLSSIKNTYELIFVNDGSRDDSAQILNEICNNDSNVRVINFSRNFGHQAAITAGIDYAKGRTVVIIDADLQDPPELIPDMIKKWKEGYEVVYGKRLKRNGETFFKKITAKIYYRLLKSITSYDIPLDTGDFRLIDRKVCDAIKGFRENNRFVRGLVSWTGFKQTFVEYEREERFAGETKYPLKKMIKLALDGIFSFSYTPLKLASTLGFIISFCSFLYLLLVIFEKIIGMSIQGWASIIIAVLFTQGIVLMVLGIMGEYIGRIYDEVKARPIYIVDDTLGYNSSQTPVESEMDGVNEK